MGGMDPKKAKRKRRSHVTLSRSSVPDTSNIEFTLDLLGVQIGVLKNVKVGAVLKIQLRQQDRFASVVCITNDGEILGSLAAFEGLAKLVTYLSEGQKFHALVIGKGSGRCEVEVYRDAN